MSVQPVLFHDAETYRHARLRSTLADLRAGLAMSELWGTMGWLDMRQRYRRSMLGPFWVTLSLLAFVVGLGITYGALFQMPLTDYLPYLCVGIVVWTLLSGFLLEGCTAFTSADSAIKQMPAPLSIHVFRLVWRSLIVFLHNLVIVALVLLVFGINPGWTGFLALPGIAVILVLGIAFGLFLGTLSARFRDIPPLMTNIVQTLFFVTPVIWHADSLKTRQAIAEWNPFFHLIEIARAPLLGVVPSGTSWAISLGFTALACLAAVLFYARFRWRIPYWL